MAKRWAGLAFMSTIGFSGCGLPSPQPSASHLFFGGEILTLDATAPVVEALAVGEGAVLAAGARSEVMTLRDPDTRLIDLGGKVLMPSLKNHHLHVLDIGFSLLNEQKQEALFLDLSAASSPEEIARRVADRASKTPEGGWILGKGWSQGAWGTGALPTHHLLSRAAPKHPVFLARTDGHCGWANAEALRLAGISRTTPDPHGGVILRLEDGTPSGILLERANERVLEHLPEPSDQDVMNAFRIACRALAAQGLTEVYDAGFLAFPGVVGLGFRFERTIELARRVESEEPLPLTVNLMIPSPSPLAEEVLRRPGDYWYSPRLKVTHVKLFQDGALGSRSAALRLPYTDDPSTRGVQRMTVEELEKEVSRALDAGLDVATHAIGDEAVGRVLDVYESVLKREPRISPRRLRVEHFSFASGEDMQRAARLGVVLVVQPGFVYPDEKGKTMEDERLGEERSLGALAFGRLLRLGATLAGSSDDFATLSPPFWNFYAAVSRKNPSGAPPDGWHGEERLSREEALHLFTRLYPPGGGEPESGLLRRDGPADMVVVSANPLTARESEIPAMRVHATILGGEVVWSDGSIPGLALAVAGKRELLISDSSPGRRTSDRY